MQTAETVNEVIAGTDVQMIGVGQLHLAADLAQIHCGNAAFYGGARADIHEHGGLNRAVYGLKLAAAGLVFGLQNFEHVNFLYTLPNCLSSAYFVRLVTTGLPCGQTVRLGVVSTFSTTKRTSLSLSARPPFIAALQDA